MKNNILIQDTHNKQWPDNGLEILDKCPICSGKERTILYEDLKDILFLSPGVWRLYSCKSCHSAYLDPRPSLETINLAYKNYFSYFEGDDFPRLSILNKLKRIMANGYRNYLYGTRDYPANKIGIYAAKLLPTYRNKIEVEMRNLPIPSNKSKILDLGCGNGKFLSRAKSAGFEVLGIDFDSQVVESCKKKGLNVKLGGIEILYPYSAQFDIITMSHVIEHVHNPIAVLQACYKLIAAGGFLWIETPNIHSEGHRIFRSSWRGLEPPRHLTIFTLSSMISALQSVGFQSIEVQPYRTLCREIFHSSKDIYNIINPHDKSCYPNLNAMVNQAEQIARNNVSAREFITLKAQKTALR